MKDNFEKIENWLKANAEKISMLSLQEPANKSELDKLEKIVGKNLPDDFKALYLWHNGLKDEQNFGSLFYGMNFYPIDQVISDYLDKKASYSSETIPLKKADSEIDPSNIYNKEWLKFAFDGAHTGLFLDLAPSGIGKYGQIIFIDNEYEIGILVAHSTAELIENLKNDLENNRYHLDEDALEDDNHYLVTTPEIDIVNWETSQKWKR